MHTNRAIAIAKHKQCHSAVVWRYMGVVLRKTAQQLRCPCVPIKDMSQINCDDHTTRFLCA